MENNLSLEDKLLDAIYHDDLALIDELINQGADINSDQWPNIKLVNINEASPLILTTTFGYIEAMALLIKRGANVNYRSFDFHIATPLIAAVITNNLAAVKLLLANGANIDEIDGNGNTAFLIACDGADESFLPIMRYLLNLGADLYHVNNQGNSALIESLSADDEAIPVWSFLIENGIDIHHKNSAGDTAIMLAERLGYSAAVDFFRQYHESKNNLSILDNLILNNTKKEMNGIEF